MKSLFLAAVALIGLPAAARAGQCGVSDTFLAEGVDIELSSPGSVKALAPDANRHVRIDVAVREVRISAEFTQECPVKPIVLREGDLAEANLYLEYLETPTAQLRANDIPVRLGKNNAPVVLAYRSKDRNELPLSRSAVLAIFDDLVKIMAAQAK